ncbi:hypothetical protein WME76_31600 [Sorangium sp. So ce119]|uniref:hypothetical protein n=1 Tax=Sorangium sp. So ce119 TaxID=3133279 RepID=UPI003F5E12A5
MREVRSTPFVLAASLLAGAALAGCSGSMRFVSQGTEMAPNANALIVAEVDRSTSTTQLNLKVDHLPPPERLGGRMFVAWAKPEQDDEWRRIGALDYDPVMHRGELFGATVARASFDLVISAEPDSYSDVPSSVVVISQDISD